MGVLGRVARISQLIDGRGRGTRDESMIHLAGAAVGRSSVDEHVVHRL